MADVLTDASPLPGAAGLADAAVNPTGTRLASLGPAGVTVWGGGKGAPLWARAGGFALPDGAAPLQAGWKGGQGKE